MDAFSVALSIGTLRLPNRANIFLSCLVGTFHFFMPLMGTILGSVFYAKLHMDLHVLSGIIFFYIAIMMIKDFKKEEEQFSLSLVSSLLFALGVSMDSFGVGFTIQMSTMECLQSFLIFTCCSGLFTFLGLKLGGVLKSVVGDYSILLGALIMVILGILNFCQLLLL